MEFKYYDGPYAKMPYDQINKIEQRPLLLTIMTINLSRILVDHGALLRKANLTSIFLLSYSSLAPILV